MGEQQVTVEAAAGCLAALAEDMSSYSKSLCHSNSKYKYNRSRKEERWGLRDGRHQPLASVSNLRLRFDRFFKVADPSELSQEPPGDFKNACRAAFKCVEWNLSSLSHSRELKERVQIQNGSTQLERNIFWIESNSSAGSSLTPSVKFNWKQQQKRFTFRVRGL